MKKLVLFPCICIALLTHGQITTIHDIQYSTTGPSPLDGMTVTTEGVVTASNEWDNLGAAAGGGHELVIGFDLNKPEGE